MFSMYVRRGLPEPFAADDFDQITGISRRPEVGGALLSKQDRSALAPHLSHFALKFTLMT